ncbi:MAG: pyruvate ferredoxin oxidoreductase [Gammaproteobacteria bacterium]|nr:pyruvate ferredoxin oxidoreductase [Gammaproteobacteria bacterium]NIR82399.1 pyruvate ferredoxin oxidoreductase [Gammaproteobacteria bacterium]NIR91980.1 pyruvate ferredoxin oxidoreductase [Gammaproteobacteria bacterium]NIU03536.1 pyruvate ferredoxin oxidoreductase [Gammaproteobacteria bacterium]NIX84810.1 pyruvate ferredoxin oxidoreductase [Gammaproteobacteria bacterium]
MNPPKAATAEKVDIESARAARRGSVELISGSEAVAHAVKLADVDVITAYPIRPYDTVMQYVSKMIANGEFDCEYIVAESEHSQFEIVKHASAIGARVFVGSSGVGWFYAFEALAVTAGLRLPMVAMVGNRALDDPGAFGVEHNDALAVRDLGWMLVWVDTAQEALDTALIAYRVAEDSRVFLPCAISCDGAFLTHSQGLVNVPTKEMVDSFLPPYDRAEKQLHPDNPITIAPQANEDWVMEIRRQSDMAARRARGVLMEAYEDFNAQFGRGGEPFIERYMMEDAEVALVGMGTLAMSVKVAVRKLREQGKKVGFVRVRWFRPFPSIELRDALSKVGAVGVIDRDYSFGSNCFGGVLSNELRGALYTAAHRPKVLSFIAGLGGREVNTDNVIDVADRLLKVAEGGDIDDQDTYWIGVRE